MKYKLIILFIIAAVLIGCEPSKKGHNSILFVNNSDDDIYVIEWYYYPDTLFHHNWNSISSNQDQTKVYAKTSSNKPLWLFWGDTWEMEFRTAIKSDTLLVFILNVDSIERWENIDNIKLGYHPDDAVLKRLYLSLEDLNCMDWTIVYP